MFELFEFIGHPNMIMTQLFKFELIILFRDPNQIISVLKIEIKIKIKTLLINYQWLELSSNLIFTLYVLQIQE